MVNVSRMIDRSPKFSKYWNNHYNMNFDRHIIIIMLKSFLGKWISHASNCQKCHVVFTINRFSISIDQHEYIYTYLKWRWIKEADFYLKYNINYTFNPILFWIVKYTYDSIFINLKLFKLLIKICLKKIKISHCLIIIYSNISVIYLFVSVCSYNFFYWKLRKSLKNIS